MKRAGTIGAVFLYLVSVFLLVVLTIAIFTIYAAFNTVVIPQFISTINGTGAVHYEPWQEELLSYFDIAIYYLPLVTFIMLTIAVAYTIFRKTREGEQRWL